MHISSLLLNATLPLAVVVFGEQQRECRACRARFRMRRPTRCAESIQFDAFARQLTSPEIPIRMISPRAEIDGSGRSLCSCAALHRADDIPRNYRELLIVRTPAGRGWRRRDALHTHMATSCGVSEAQIDALPHWKPAAFSTRRPRLCSLSPTKWTRARCQRRHLQEIRIHLHAARDRRIDAHRRMVYRPFAREPRSPLAYRR